MFVGTEFETAFLKRKKEAEGVFSFFFAKPENFSFLPGQYVDVTVPVNGRNESYSFTLSSSPDEEELRFTTRKSLSVYKEALFSLKKGQMISMSGPHGGFILNEEDKPNLVFLSGGVGITPFRSMILHLVSSFESFSVILLASFSKIEDMIFYTEFQKIMKQHKNVHIIYTLSSENSPTWNGENGRINESIIKKYVSNLADYHFFIAGGNDMVDDTVILLQKMGIENKKIKTDTFTGY
jgi:ferredoxin-NADP reductase